MEFPVIVVVMVIPDEIFPRNLNPRYFLTLLPDYK